METDHRSDRVNQRESCRIEDTKLDMKYVRGEVRGSVGRGEDGWTIEVETVVSFYLQQSKGCS